MGKITRNGENFGGLDEPKIIYYSGRSSTYCIVWGQFVQVVIGNVTFPQFAEFWSELNAQGIDVPESANYIMLYTNGNNRTMGWIYLQKDVSPTGSNFTTYNGSSTSRTTDEDYVMHGIITFVMTE